MMILDACRIEEGRYFLDNLQIDMEPIVKDIREAHVGDKETATDTTVADKVNEIFDNVKKSGEGKGDPDFLQILTTQFCLEIGMSPKNMSLQEIDTLQSIFVRSRKYKQVINQTKNKKMKRR